MPIHMQKCKYCSRKQVKVGKSKRYFEFFRISIALFQFTNPFHEASAGILEQSMGARNRIGTGLSYQAARLHRLACGYDNSVPSPERLF